MRAITIQANFFWGGLLPRTRARGISHKCEIFGGKSSMEDVTQRTNNGAKKKKIQKTKGVFGRNRYYKYNGGRKNCKLITTQKIIM